MNPKQLGIAIAAACSLWLFPAAESVQARGATSALTERGQYLVSAGNCAECHTANGGKPFAGGLAIQTPFGTIYSTNITPDRDTGIGGWSSKEFYKAMHDGVGRGGKRLYPAFPYPWFTKINADDVGAIKAYLDTLPAVKQMNTQPKLQWPFSIREVMIGWNFVNFHEGDFRTDPGKSTQWNRGAYLVEGLGHCGECHTPMNMLGAPKKGDELEGGDVGNWYASNLGASLRDGLGAWSPQDIVEYLKKGSNAKTAATGPMADVIRDSTTHLNDADLNAIATYLKDLPSAPTAADAKATAADQHVLAGGKALYGANCGGCHFASGAGMAKVFPPLKASAIVQGKDPATVLQVIVGGGQVVTSKQQPWPYHMPAFGQKLSDQQIAEIATYVRSAWGNRAGVVSAADVAKVRKEDRPPATK